MQFAGVDLGDERRNRRLPQLVDELVRHPGGTLPQKLPQAADQEAFYRLCNAESVTHAAVLAPHRERMRKKLQDSKQFLLVVHDATEFDFSSRKSLKQLGQIGNGRGRGYIVHQSLVVDPGQGLVLGLANQILHQRKNVAKTEGVAKKRRRFSRESRLWVKGTAELPGRKQVVDVCDRGADTFEFLEHEVRSGRTFVIRACYNRNVQQGHEDPHASIESMVPLLRSLPAQATCEMAVRVPLTGVQKKNRKKKKKKTSPPASRRVAQLALSATRLRVHAPHVRRGEHGREPLVMYAVRVWEPNPPPGCKPMEWILLTNHPVETANDLLRVKSWYEWRWVIEEYHKGQKTGCAIESLQFRGEDRLKPALAILSIVALTLLKLRNSIRDSRSKQQRADDEIDPLAIKVLSQYLKKKPQPDWSIYDYAMALAQLGGYRKRKDCPPGWVTLWRGHTKLELMLDGVRTMQRLK
jgi:hypothetical protein